MTRRGGSQNERVLKQLRQAVGRVAERPPAGYLGGLQIAWREACSVMLDREREYDERGAAAAARICKRIESHMETRSPVRICEESSK